MIGCLGVAGALLSAGFLAAALPDLLLASLTLHWAMATDDSESL